MSSRVPLKGETRVVKLLRGKKPSPTLLTVCLFSESFLEGVSFSMAVKWLSCSRGCTDCPSAGLGGLGCQQGAGQKVLLSLGLMELLGRGTPVWFVLLQLHCLWRCTQAFVALVAVPNCSFQRG